jgi:hypothetical protein
VTRRITTLYVLRIVEETDDDRPSRPSLRACKVVETTGQTVSETSRPLAKVLPLHSARKAG